MAAKGFGTAGGSSGHFPMIPKRLPVVKMSKSKITTIAAEGTWTTQG
jgi:hypothetical protein